MTISEKKIYPRTGDTQTVYLKNVITDPAIEVGEYTMYNDFVNDPKDFQSNNVLYHYPINGDRLIIENSAQLHVEQNLFSQAPTISLARCPPILFRCSLKEWDLDKTNVTGLMG